MEAFIETRGRNPIKNYKIEAGELKKFSLSEEYNIRYKARASGWKIKIRKINGKLLVFREK